MRCIAVPQLALGAFMGGTARGAQEIALEFIKAPGASPGTAGPNATPPAMPPRVGGAVEMANPGGRSSLGPEGDEPLGVRLEPRRVGDTRVDQVYAVGDRWKDGVQTFADALGAAGEIHDQRAAADPRGLPLEDRGGHVLERQLPHQLAEAGQEPCAGQCCGFGGDVSRRGAGATGGHNQAAAGGG